MKLYKVIIKDYLFGVIHYPLFVWAKEEMKNTVCTCPETGHPDEFGDGSSLPCMEIDSDLCCSQCTWCELKKELL